MNSLSELISKAKDIMKKYPMHRTEILSLLQLCEDEIEEGGSEIHEVQLCYNDICDLVGIDE